MIQFWQMMTSKQFRCFSLGDFDIEQVHLQPKGFISTLANIFDVWQSYMGEGIREWFK